MCLSHSITNRVHAVNLIEIFQTNAKRATRQPCNIRRHDASNIVTSLTRTAAVAVIADRILRSFNYTEVIHQVQ